MAENKKTYIKNLFQLLSHRNQQNGDQAGLIPLSHTIIKHLFILFASLIIGITLIIHLYLSQKMEDQFHDQLHEYIIQRGKRESELFSLARDNLIWLKSEFIFQYYNDPRQDFTGWFNSHLYQQKEGTFSSSKQYFDGVWTPGGIFEHGMGMAVGPDVKITKELMRRMGIAHHLILKYGPAWRSRFVNLWFAGPEKYSLNYWPDVKPDSRMPPYIGEQLQKRSFETHRKNSTEQQIIWTGLYFDPVSGQWMISAALPIEIKGKLIGAFGTDIECGDFFNRNLSDSAVSSYSLILDQEGYIIIHPYKIAETISSRNPRFTVEMANDVNLSFLYDKIKSVSVFPVIIENKKNDELIAVTKIEGPNWYLASVYYKALFKEQIMKDVLFSITLGIGSLMAALFIIYFVVKKNISHPIGILTQAAENFNALSRKNDSVNYALHLKGMGLRFDEFGLLSRTFTTAGMRLKKVYQDLENAKINLEVQVLERTKDLAQAKKVAEAANRAKSRFLANMSHELRTPLHVILGFSRLMQQDSSLKPDQRENLRLIHESGDQLLSLINDVLDLSKIESKNISFNPCSFDLVLFLESLMAMFQQRAAEKNLTFSLEKQSGLPRHIKTDKTKLRQVMINLIGNAIKYTNNGSVVLRVCRTQSYSRPLPFDRDDGSFSFPVVWIRFRIKDTGMGIDPRDMDIIFRRFGRARYGSPGGSGTGLGLHISSHFLRIMGSRLNVESESGHGTDFFFDLPVGIGDSHDIEKATPCRLPRGLAPDQTPCSVLVAEDHEQSRSLLNILLTDIGFKVHMAENGKKAVDLFFRLKPDLVLMDIRMPLMDGLSAVKKMKSSDKMSQVPVIALTAHAFENERARILDAGFDDFLSKPLDEATLFECISQHTGLVFIYETDPKTDLAQESVSLRETETEAITEIPDQISTELINASAELNQEKTIACIEKIKKIDKSTAEHLTLLAREFRFEEILIKMQINKKA